MKFQKEEFEIVRAIIEEVETLLSKAEEIIVINKWSESQLTDLIRAFHTIKGVVGFLQLQDVVELSHFIESSLKDVLNSGVEPTHKLIDFMFDSIDEVRKICSQLEDIVRESTDFIEIKPENFQLSNLLTQAKSLNEEPSEQNEESYSKDEENVKESTNTEGKQEEQTSAQEKKFEHELAQSTLKDFLDELEDRIQELDRLIQDYEKTFEIDIAHSIMRTFHSIKGGARLVLSLSQEIGSIIKSLENFKNLQELVHLAETYVSSKIQLGENADIEILYEIVDIIVEFQNAITSDTPFGEIERLNVLLERLSETTSKKEPEKPKVQPYEVPKTLSESQVNDLISELMNLLNNFDSKTPIEKSETYRIARNLIETICETFERLGRKEEALRVSSIKEHLDSGDVKSALEQLNTILKEAPRIVPEKLQEIPKTQIESKKPKSHISSELQTIRVAKTKIDEIYKIASEFITMKNELKHLIRTSYFADNTAEVIENFERKFSRLTYELSNVALDVRKIPLRYLFNQFRRTTRELAKNLGKKVEVIVEGEDVEVDRDIVELLVDPITHMLRNAVDHGIEYPEERKRLGKPETGTVKISASYSGNFAMIEISDDGRGFDTKKIKEKAVKQGLISKEEADKLSEKEVANLIFLPGFSTKDQVSQTSGRGYGMDIVMSTMNKIGGQVNLDWVPSKGSKISLKIPLHTLYIKALIFKVENRKFAIPMEYLQAVQNIHIKDVYSYKNQQFIRYLTELIPIFSARDLLISSGSPSTQSTFDKRGKYYALIVKTEKSKFALTVDKIIEEGEYVGMELPYGSPGNFYSGTTITGDGTVALILDPDRFWQFLTLSLRNKDRIPEVEGNHG
ncbi:MAG: Hpt domain-containing protein [Fervidobacterium sp.]|uniref:Hpt domain-containing protein n=1 Tax=Fervidobacterium sp. TaxID=1871331 RepID=UPI00404A2F21